MKKFLVVMLMLLMLCVVGCDGKKAEGAGVVADEVVMVGETLGKPISDKSIYKSPHVGTYDKVVDGMLFSCTEVEGKIESMTLLFQVASYVDAVSTALKAMTDYANKHNNGIYFASGENFFVTRYKGNNVVAATFAPNPDDTWAVSFTFKKLSKEGLNYIKYIEE